MAMVHRIYVKCDLCGDPLCWPEDDQGSDGMDTRFFDNIAVAESAAIASGWEPVNPHDDHIDRQLRCAECVGRRLAMRSWIKANRMLDHAG